VRGGAAVQAKLGVEAERLAEFLWRSLPELPTDRGEALTVTDFHAVCHRSVFYKRLEGMNSEAFGMAEVRCREPWGAVSRFRWPDEASGHSTT
jgi:hypothetical protein